MKDLSIALSIIAIAVTFLGVLWQYFGGFLAMRKELAGSEKELRELIAAQNNRLVAAETKMELFWNAVGGVVSSLIKQPIHFEKDALMDKLMEGHISKSELHALKHILQEEVADLRETKQTQSLAYALALAYIEQKLFDYNFAERLQEGVAS